MSEPDAAVTPEPVDRADQAAANDDGTATPANFDATLAQCRAAIAAARESLSQLARERTPPVISPNRASRTRTGIRKRSR